MEKYLKITIEGENLISINIDKSKDIEVDTLIQVIKIRLIPFFIEANLDLSSFSLEMKEKYNYKAKKTIKNQNEWHNVEYYDNKGSLDYWFSWRGDLVNKMISHALIRLCTNSEYGLFEYIDIKGLDMRTLKLKIKRKEYN